MVQVTLGKTGIIVEKNSFGALPIQRISKEEAVKLLRKAYDHGVTFFDTARFYTDSEEKVGEAFKGMREKVYIATKTGATTVEGFWKDLHTSLGNLQTDYIDIYQFHNPSFCPKPGDGTGLYEAMLEAKNKGMVRHIGITNHRLHVAKEAIESGLYERQAIAQKISNFESLLPAPQSELAVQTMKDPYVFDFIPFKEDMVERDIENALVKDVTALLLELGTGFAFLGNQYHLNVGGDDFYIDLLFYNLNLRCYVVIELKTGDFKPEYAGQLNFYLSAVDAQLKKDTDNPTIGLLLCKNKNNLVAEYSLKDMSKPMGISEYKISSVLPEELSQQLPSVEDIQKRIK